ncbi:peptidase inhibitor family I36 protein [Kitasatospora sp. NPDC088160]|uniref:peptidase inhibitor family I36 protein n=1 Tax=Kitasatospora sp. NPDC088160 TaxID=3364072 RepID=UPI003816C15E
MTHSQVRSLLVRGVVAFVLLAAPLGARAAAAPSTGEDARPAIRNLARSDRDLLQQAVDAQLTASKDGKQTAANEITYPDGAVVVLPLPGEAQAPPWSGDHHRRSARGADWKKCPAPTSEPSYYCFYADKNWGGRRLQFNLFHEDRPVYFADYGFRDQTSSWVNTARGLEVIVDNDPGDGQWQMLWKEPPESLSASVGFDNMADRFWAVRQ